MGCLGKDDPTFAQGGGGAPHYVGRWAPDRAAMGVGRLRAYPHGGRCGQWALSGFSAIIESPQMSRRK